MKVNVSIGWVVWLGVGAGVDREVCDESESDVCAEVSEWVELKVWGRVVLIKISNMKLIWILLII